MLITSFDKEVEKRIKFFEREFNCLIFISKDETSEKFFMGVAYPAENRIVDNIELCGVNESKYSLMSAIRKYFK